MVKIFVGNVLRELKKKAVNSVATDFSETVNEVVVNGSRSNSTE